MIHKALLDGSLAIIGYIYVEVTAMFSLLAAANLVNNNSSTLWTGPPLAVEGAAPTLPLVKVQLLPQRRDPRLIAQYPGHFQWYI